MTQTYEQVDPTTIAIGDNVRLDPRLDKEFIASVRERGVLEPVLLYRGEDGTLTVLAGQRRTLAAQQVARPLIPALVDDQPPAEVDRLVDQYVENEHRAALSNSEKITAIEQMALAGLSDHQIAKRTATPKATVQAAKTAAAAPALREFADQLTLDQAAALTEFEDDTDAVEALLNAAQAGRFDHIAQRLRDDRADAAKRAAFTATLTAQGLTVVEDPGYSTTTPVRRLSQLKNTDGTELTPANHTECPGHAAYVTTSWRRPSELTDTNQIVVTEDDELDQDQDEDQDEDGDLDEDEDDGTMQLEQYAEVLVAGYVCTDPTTHGHQDRWTSGGYATANRTKAADMTETEREAAKAARRTVIESNKAWKAATTVRRDWMPGFARRKTAPAGAEAYLARVITEGWGRERASSDDLTLAGFPGDGTSEPWTQSHAQRQAVAEATATATPKRALQIALAVAVAMWENRTNPDTWRSHTDQDVLTLRCLKDWGYPTSEIEDRLLATTDSDHDPDDD